MIVLEDRPKDAALYLLRYVGPAWLPISAADTAVHGAKEGTHTDRGLKPRHVLSLLAPTCPMIRSHVSVWDDTKAVSSSPAKQEFALYSYLWVVLPFNDKQL